MALATRCPACETIFRISTTQAAAKSGMVRCGQCRHVFNSLDALVRVEDLDVVEEDVADPAAPASMAADSATPAGAAADGLSQGVDAGGLSAGAPIDAALGSHNDAASLAESPASAPAGEAVFSKWWLPHGEPVAAPPASEAEIPKVTGAGFKQRSLADRRVSVEWPRNTAAYESANRAAAIHDPAVHDPTFLRDGAPRQERSRAERWTLAVLSVIAAVGLAGQAAYVWRNEVAVRYPAAKPWLVAICAPLRCAVDYPAHIDSITIESTSLQSSTPNSNFYTLTALLRNRDTVAVRYPWLELTLTDTQDRPILRRALRPEDYLARSRGAGNAQGGFGAESELPIRVMFELNELRFVGYRLDRFYP